MIRWAGVVAMAGTLLVASSLWAGGWRAVGPGGSPARATKAGVCYEAGKGAEAEEQEYQARRRWQEKKAVEMLEGVDVEVSAPVSTK